MGNTSRFSIACALVLVVAQAVAGPTEDSVAKAFSAWNAAFNKGDAKAVAAFYVQDAVVLPASHDVKKGPKEIEEFFVAVLKSGLTGHALEPFRIIDSGKSVIVASKWSASGKDDKGNAASFGGLATHVFQKQPDNSYKLSLHTFN